MKKDKNPKKVIAFFGFLLYYIYEKTKRRNKYEKTKEKYYFINFIFNV